MDLIRRLERALAVAARAPLFTPTRLNFDMTDVENPSWAIIPTRPGPSLRNNTMAHVSTPAPASDPNSHAPSPSTVAAMAKTTAFLAGISLDSRSPLISNVRTEASIGLQPAPAAGVTPSVQRSSRLAREPINLIVQPSEKGEILTMKRRLLGAGANNNNDIDDARRELDRFFNDVVDVKNFPAFRDLFPAARELSDEELLSAARQAAMIGIAPWTPQRGRATPQNGTFAADASELGPPHRFPRAPFPIERAINCQPRGRNPRHGADAPALAWVETQIQGRKRQWAGGGDGVRLHVTSTAKFAVVIVVAREEEEVGRSQAGSYRTLHCHSHSRDGRSHAHPTSPRTMLLHVSAPARTRHLPRSFPSSSSPPPYIADRDRPLAISSKSKSSIACAHNSSNTSCRKIQAALESQAEPTKDPQDTYGMGNLVSQCFTSGGGAAGERPLVVAKDGSRKWVEENTGVAELMIEAPGHVVARASDVMTKDRRVRAMAADELLRAGEAYLLVPAGRAGARLGDREVEAIGMLVSGKKKKSRKSSRHGGGKRVFPAAAEVVDVEDAVVEGKEKENALCAGKWAQDHHGPKPIQWRPALDTIYEA
ncbi:hypothetical protein HU200_056767 [Digitaria exilis]|uniref:Uncharacterized protein n=1 Tax=Digitaria exilis TaxID=1010633 RepID=A0A835ACD0_9POAL|nr:hypothetical protein HU200_056767 [Digitaria exilis]